MSKGKMRGVIGIIFIALLLRLFVPAVMAKETNIAETAAVRREIQSLTTQGIEMVDQAMSVLSQEWPAMSATEKALFLALYDPAGTGTVDAEFVHTVTENFQKIRHSLEQDVRVSYKAEHRLCVGQRLYYTDYLSIHVCPYFFTETNEARKVRELIHEYAHIALRVKDRPYYRPTSRAYATLTPRGSRAAQLPFVGPIVREIMANDTLYHPDAYAHLALVLSSRPGIIDKYVTLDNGVPSHPSDLHLSGSETDYPVTDSWQRP